MVPLDLCDRDPAWSLREAVAALAAEGRFGPLTVATIPVNDLVPLFRPSGRNEVGS